jgi:hypothetical protein
VSISSQMAQPLSTGCLSKCECAHVETLLLAESNLFKFRNLYNLNNNLKKFALRQCRACILDSYRKNCKRLNELGENVDFIFDRSC